MEPLIARLAVLVALGIVIWLIVLAGRRYVETRRAQALRAAPLALSSTSSGGDRAQVHILAFSSEDCAQCHRMQTPALHRVLEARRGAVAVEEIDAPSSPELAGRYHILTVPSTVVLGADGRAHAVNYGFAPTSKLLEQVDELVSAEAARQRCESAAETMQ